MTEIRCITEFLDHLAKNQIFQIYEGIVLLVLTIGWSASELIEWYRKKSCHHHNDHPHGS